MEPIVEELVRLMPELKRAQLDFSAESLAVLGGALLCLYRESEGPRFMRSAYFEPSSRYVEVTNCRCLNRRWSELCTSHSVSFRPPELLRNFALYRPLESLLTPAIGRREPNFAYELLLTEIRNLESYFRRRIDPPVQFSREQLARMRFRSPQSFDSWMQKRMKRIRSLKRKLIPIDLASKLDDSQDSLVPLEQWLLETFCGSTELMDRGFLLLAECLSQYVGDVFVEGLGQDWVWAITFDPQARELSGLPMITPKSYPSRNLCPLIVVLEAVDARTGDHLMTAIASNKT